MLPASKAAKHLPRVLRDCSSSVIENYPLLAVGVKYFVGPISSYLYSDAIFLIASEYVLQFCNYT